MSQHPEKSDTITGPATPPHSGPEEADKTSVQPAGVQRTSMTPPPSMLKAQAQLSNDAPNSVMATPTTTRRNATRDLPSTDRIERAGLEELRSMAQNLVNDLTDARINASNARLQHHLLLLETSQAAERAEVERQLSRTQVDFLRVKQKKPEQKPAPASAPAQRPAELDTINQSMKELESHYEALEELCGQLQREKELQAERIQSLTEHNVLLVKRIRENRENFTRIRERSPAVQTARETYTTPRRKYARYQDDTPAHAPFAALIAADQLLSQETASVSSTPTKVHAVRFKPGHTRGAHSLSSINTAQHASRPLTSDGFLGSQLVLSAPGSQLVMESAEREHHHRDRDSTISISDNDASQDPALVASQASSLAADMLRKNPSTYESLRQSQEAERSSNLLQSQIFGPVKKPSTEPSAAKLKRQYGFGESHQKPQKKVRTEENVGLGIAAR
ncbi:hypothetical protein LTS08_003091 [Lithohypha guttulata]|uniref:uncharacterized protein n=1 Tax=Lithohypha guttulata TaxID=1690604 RepID=UPI002DE1B2D8|nr:hypothetical protein LTR51_000253 [Lithohypha guttulata]KAK5103673.1 hypothetical protein LTS08_003091 [Lithohypha guttulata]